MGQQYDWHCERALLDLTTARRVEIQEAGDVLADGGKTPQRTETAEGAGGLQGAPSLTRS